MSCLEYLTHHTIWLAYVAYPITTGVYFERALRERCRTITVGPPLPGHFIEKWHLQKLKLPLKEQDISTDFRPDMAEIVARTPPEELPDLYLWIESVGGYSPLNLDTLPCPKACFLIDCHLKLAPRIEWAKKFDIVFIAQKEYLEDFRKLGMQVHWLPLGCDPDIHRHYDMPKNYPISFDGSIPEDSRREKLLTYLASHIPVNYDRCFWEDRARLFSESKIIFNSSAQNDLNMRTFEVMSAGSMVMSDLGRNSGQDILFVNGEDYALYNDQNMVDVAKFYLENEELRERIAARGQQLVHNAHTIGHRVDDLLAVTLGGKADTFSAEELRERSLTGVTPFYTEICNEVLLESPVRSFVIPVLDYSPASKYNIRTLLDDLEYIEGEVIVVFNGSAVGKELMNHPRITRYAIMKQNVGVSRGWNIGMEMAEAETVFIVNADAHITEDAIKTVEYGLNTLPQAACVGPQGAFVDFELCRDYKYFDKGSFESPMLVDAVSGFFFAVNRRLFSEHGLHFENAFTPCYFEEWDIGLQIKRVGLKSYIVPTSAYEHHWSGTIAALRTIPYMGHDESVELIQKRNRMMFVAKWRQIARDLDSSKLLDSLWKDALIEKCGAALIGGDMNMAKSTAEQLNRYFADDEEASAFIKVVVLQAMKQQVTD